MHNIYETRVEFGTEPENEGFARVVVAGFLSRLNPTLEELADVRTAVSEAVTNSIIHGYDMKGGMIRLICRIIDSEIEIIIEDNGVGIADIEKAMEPLYTSKPEMERSGMGFSFMEAFMDEVSVESTPGQGTIVTMKKKIAKEKIMPDELGKAVGFE